MKRNTWMHLVLAAALVLVAGVALAESETVKVKVKKTSADHEVMVDVGGAAQVFTLADLDDGEQREVPAGELGAGGEPRAFVFKHHGGATDPVVVDLAARKDMVTYRCDETGSQLTVRKEHAVHDSYTDPATGCVMTRVETRRVKVVKVVEGGADPS